MQRHLQYLRHVQITGQHVRLLPESAHLDATAATSLAGVTQRLALPHQLLHVHIRVEYRRVAMALADHLAPGTKETLRRTGTDVDGAAGLEDMQLLDRLQHGYRPPGCRRCSGS